MAWLGICYEGSDLFFLQEQLSKHEKWLKGDRLPRAFGNQFVLIYDSNTAREFVKKIKGDLRSGRLVVYTIPSVLLEVKK